MFYSLHLLHHHLSPGYHHLFPGLWLQPLYLHSYQSRYSLLHPQLKKNKTKPNNNSNPVVLIFSVLFKAFQSLPNDLGINARPCNVACRKNPAYFFSLTAHSSFSCHLHLSHTGLHSFLHSNASSHHRVLDSVIFSS